MKISQTVGKKKNGFTLLETLVAVRFLRLIPSDVYVLADGGA